MQVGMAAPIAAALATGTRDKEAELSENYGGAAGTKGGAADPVYASIGRVSTWQAHACIVVLCWQKQHKLVMTEYGWM